MKRIVGCLAAFVMMMFLFGGSYGAVCSESLRESFLRFHIRANSNSGEDQKVKLYVRDRVLAETAYLFEHAATPREAIAVAGENVEVFAAAANRALREKGADYTAAAACETAWFPLRTYGEITLPAGSYHSLILRLGSGGGKNWWCVMFPPLCYTGEFQEETLAQLRENLSEEDYQSILTNPKITVKWGIAELIKECWKKLHG